MLPVEKMRSLDNAVTLTLRGWATTVHAQTLVANNASDANCDTMHDFGRSMRIATIIIETSCYDGVDDRRHQSPICDIGIVIRIVVRSMAVAMQTPGARRAIRNI